MFTLFGNMLLRGGHRPAEQSPDQLGDCFAAMRLAMTSHSTGRDHSLMPGYQIEYDFHFSPVNIDQTRHKALNNAISSKQAKAGKETIP
jgi:hypothetical protein